MKIDVNKDILIWAVERAGFNPDGYIIEQHIAARGRTSATDYTDCHG